ncbi:MAG: hypothetical protein Q7R47_06165 [Candidatus Diapherotrites archaeon]|nr:hypothetical protein [Candidatus Diapherotrites archaeon]
MNSSSTRISEITMSRNMKKPKLPPSLRVLRHNTEDVIPKLMHAYRKRRVPITIGYYPEYRLQKDVAQITQKSRRTEDWNELKKILREHFPASHGFQIEKKQPVKGKENTAGQDLRYLAVTKHGKEVSPQVIGRMLNAMRKIK